jgi:hypothetical protein
MLATVRMQPLIGSRRTFPILTALECARSPCSRPWTCPKLQTGCGSLTVVERRCSPGEPQTARIEAHEGARALTAPPVCRSTLCKTREAGAPIRRLTWNAAMRRTHIQVRGFLIVLGAALHVFYQMGRCTGDSAPKSANVSVEGCKPLRSQGVVMHSPVLVFLALLLLSGPARAQSTPPAAGAPKFIQIDDDALLSSRLIGLNVQNSIGENIGN